MSTPGGPLREFFSQFDFIGYTYNPHNPPLEEFNRLCQARQWGPSRIGRNGAAFFLAVEEEQDLRGSPAGPNVIRFFREYEYQLFTYDSDAPTQSEFQRLVELRGWGERNLAKVTRRFNRAVALDEREQSEYSTPEPTAPQYLDIQVVDLLPDWLRRQECPGYQYLGDLPELEFKKLVKVRGTEWRRTHGRRPFWRHSHEFESLHEEFYELVELDFNLHLENFQRVTGIAPWQLFVGLYGEGRVHVKEKAAKKMLKQVFINIFDFIETFRETFKNPPRTNLPELLRRLKRPALGLRLQSNMMLGVYSAVTDRVFPPKGAKQGGTLALLLRPIGGYLSRSGEVLRAFTREAGDELRVAKEEGHYAVRNLLLSREWICFHDQGSG